MKLSALRGSSAAVLALACIGASTLLVGCDTRSPAETNGRVAIIDLQRIEKETGRDIARFKLLDQLKQQKQIELSQIKQHFDQIADAEHQKLGPMASPEATAKFEQMAQGMGNQMNSAIEAAQQDVARANIEIITKFKQEIGEVSQKVAFAKGLSIVVDKNAGVIAFAPDVDITDAVLDEIRKNPLPPVSVSSGQGGPGGAGPDGSSGPGPGPGDQAGGPPPSPFSPGLLPISKKPQPTTAPATAP